MIDLDYNGDGEINFSEFVAATFDWDTYLTTENLRTIFDHFDTDHTGLLHKGSISTSFIRASRYIDEESIDFMIKEAVNKDTINFEEFVSLMRNED